MTGFCYSPLVPEHDTRAHPERRERIDAIVQAVEGRDWGGRLTPFEPRPCSEADILRVHTPHHLHHVAEFCRKGGGSLDADTFVSPGSYDAAMLAAGMSIQAVDAVLDGTFRNAFCATRPPGHHATPDTSMGFCLFNNIAIAARHALDVRGLNRVLIVDWDVHHGNGTQDAFYEDPRVFFFSIHQSPLYPGTGRASERGAGNGTGTTLNLPQAPYMPALRTREDFRRGLAAGREFGPEIVLISAGFDAHKDDPLANLRLTEEDFGEMTREVMNLAEEACEGRIVSLLEGGYHLEALAASVIAHLEALAGV